MSKRLARADKERISHAICSQLPLTQRERETVISVVKSIDFSCFGSVGSIEAVTLGTVGGRRTASTAIRCGG